MSYQLSKQLQETMGRHSVDSLEQEILLAKAYFEGLLSSIETDADRKQYHKVIMDSLKQIELMVINHFKYQVEKNETLRKDAIRELAAKIVLILKTHLREVLPTNRYVDVVYDIATDIRKAVDNAENSESK